LSVQSVRPPARRDLRFMTMEISGSCTEQASICTRRVGHSKTPWYGHSTRSSCCATPVAVGLILGLLTLCAGCESGAASQPATADSDDGSSLSQDVAAPADATAGHAVAAVNLGPPHQAATGSILADWQKPALAIVLTGEQHGYFEPCGCTESQLGGMSRRADLFRMLREEKAWSVTALDLGGLVKRNRQQSQIKFQTLLAAHRDLGYQAMALGPEELRFDPIYLLSQHVTDPDHPDRVLSFLSANVVLLRSPELGTPMRTKLIEVNGVKVAVTAVFGKSLQSQLSSDGAGKDIEITDPAEGLAKALASLRTEKRDLIVLLAQANLDETKKLARQFPDIDFILSAGGVEDPLSDNPVHQGATMIAFAGHKAKYAGVLGFYPDREQQRLRFELVPLEEDRFRDTPKMREYMRLYQDQLRDVKLAEHEAETLAVAPVSGATYVGTEVCGDCHTQAYDVWESTPHAHAYESLIHGREGVTDPISRVYDPECLACHVVGWHPQKVVPFKSGFVSATKTPLLLGVQCENCHGPGSRHVELAEDDNVEASRKDVRVTQQTAKTTLCYSCHDLDNSPHFNFDEYWPKVEHPGVD